MKKIAIGQAGGPTAVINTSLAGFVENLPSDLELYTVENGYEGLVEAKIRLADKKKIQDILDCRYDSGACLGSGRYQFTDERIKKAVQTLKEYKIDGLVFIGGNGTMAALEKLEKMAKEEGFFLQVIGIPKTVDNDLGMTDHAPGFGSAARYVAYSARDVSLDLHAMRNFEKVRILETMGRNAGWLAAAGGIFLEKEKYVVCIPEEKKSLSHLIQEVKEKLDKQGTLVLIVSEGVEWDEQKQISKATINDRTVLGGAAEYLEQVLSKELGIFVRSENLGINQRALSLSVSDADRKEAWLVGEKAAMLLKENVTSQMVCVERKLDIPYNIRIGSCSLKEVRDAGERVLPEAFIQDREKYYKWLEPLI